MKRFALAVVCTALLLGSCQSNEKGNALVQETTASITKDAPVEKVNVGKFRFTAANNTYDFGTVNEGEVVEHDFEFKNAGIVPLVVKNAKGSCGCTVPEAPTEPIPVGETSTIKVKFNSEGRTGNIKKGVTLVANTYPVETYLTITGKVIPKEKKKK